MLSEIPTEQISLRADARAINADAVASLVDSIGAVGLINPIRVRAAGEAFELIAGAHRLEACKQLGLAEVTCVVVTDDDLHAELAMIDENLCRAELSPADRASYVTRRKEIYEAMNPAAKRGGDRKSTEYQTSEFDPTERFTLATAKATGRSESSVLLDVTRGKNVLPEVLDLIKGSPLDTGSYLDKLKKMPGSEQFQAAQRDLAFARQQRRESDRKTIRSQIDADVKARAAKEVAEIIAEHVPGEWWDAVKSNLYAAGASNIANALTNITGEAIMDRRHG